MPGRPSAIRWLWLAALVIVADQATKLLAVEQLVVHRAVPVAPSVNLTLTYNLGAAFSFLGEAGGWQRWLFISVAATVSVALTVWLVRLPAAARFTAVSLALILGGAVGNLCDLYYAGWHWPAFNVADIAIFIGAAMLVVDSLRADPDGAHER